MHGKSDAAFLPVIVGRNLIRHPRRVRIRVDDTNGGNVGQTALVEHGVVLDWVQTHDEVRDQRHAVHQVLLKVGQRAIPLVHNLYGSLVQQDLSVGNGAGRPLLEQVARLSQLGGPHNYGHVTGTVAYKQDQTAVVGHLFNDAGSATQMAGRYFEADDVNAGAHTVNVPGVGRVPDRRVVTHVGLGSHQVFERRIVRRILENLVGQVANLDIGTELQGLLLDVGELLIRSGNLGQLLLDDGKLLLVTEAVLGRLGNVRSGNWRSGGDREGA